MLNKKRNSMPTQPAEERINNFGEVELGYTEEQAVNEAQRCIQCKKPKQYRKLLKKN